MTHGTSRPSVVILNGAHPGRLSACPSKRVRDRRRCHGRHNSCDISFKAVACGATAVAKEHAGRSQQGREPTRDRLP